ncbi:hypothetical protein LSH36_488g04037 [Paralvinella palmiformis]|uniref:EGF-like domain-containing protein n=1 Tax=Paralvinella palmiformis TaxID=53620 RepID=A0AAD9J8X1_9ANNE|nr:hypothetical protein LSH36_488g04037 [Paralvinella palmiformis]
MSSVKQAWSPSGPTKPEQKRDTASKRIQTFLTESTIHGLEKLHKSHNKRRRSVWFVTVLLVWTFICIQFSLLISNFISNESNIDYKITDARQLEFPSVTICNANPIKKSALEDLAANNVQLQNLLALGVSGDIRKRRRRKRSLQLDSWFSYGNTNKEYFLSTTKKKYTDADKQYDVFMNAKFSQFTDTRRSEFVTTRMFQAPTEDPSPSTTAEDQYYGTEKGVDPDTDFDPCLKVRCQNGGTCKAKEKSYTCVCTEQFQGLHCDLDVPEDGGDFKLMSNAFLGNCYTFNSKQQASTTSKYLSTMSGRRHGLEVGVTLGLSDAFRAADGVAGAVVVIHSKDSIPFPEDYGTVLTPGVFNAISIRLVKLKRLPLPYTDCINQDVDASLKDVYITLYNATYSKTGCQKTCHQRHVIDTCQCALPYYPRYGLTFDDKIVSLCDDDNEDDNMMKKIYPNQFPVSMDDSDPYADIKIIKQNFMKVAIYYEDLNQELVSQIPVYTAFQFAGDVGGMLGLWIGFSAMGMVQLIEFILLIVWTQIKAVCFCKYRVGANG